jgi:hypothetical protein
MRASQAALRPVDALKKQLHILMNFIVKSKFFFAYLIHKNAFYN